MKIGWVLEECPLLVQGGLAASQAGGKIIVISDGGQVLEVHWCTNRPAVSQVLTQQRGWAASYFQLFRYEDISVEQGTLHQDHQHGVFAPCQLAALVPNQGVPRKWDMVLTIKDFN